MKFKHHTPLRDLAKSDASSLEQEIVDIKISIHKSYLPFRKVVNVAIVGLTSCSQCDIK